MENQSKRIESFKAAMGNYPTGVTVVTALDQQGKPMGMTVNSFASVSLDPLLVLWSIDKKAFLYEEFLKADKFVVNILAEDQSDLCNLFASRVEDRFSGCEWRASELNQPILANSLSVLECTLFKQVDAGDHTILIGEVTDIKNEEKNPLLYHRRFVGAIPKEFYK